MNTCPVYRAPRGEDRRGGGLKDRRLLVVQVKALQARLDGAEEDRARLAAAVDARDQEVRGYHAGAHWGSFNSKGSVTLY
jgi:hypothetical protein